MLSNRGVRIDASTALFVNLVLHHHISAYHNAVLNLKTKTAFYTVYQASIPKPDNSCLWFGDGGAVEGDGITIGDIDIVLTIRLLSLVSCPVYS